MMKKLLSAFIVLIMLLTVCVSINATAAISSNSIVMKNESHNASNNGTIQVTFARNNYLEIDYFYDNELTQPIDTTNCWLNKGDSIYISKIKPKKTKSNLYNFSEFRFVFYDNDGNRTDVEKTSTASGKIYTVPNDFDGKGISILPIGTYKERELKLESYYFDLEGKRVDFTDKLWRINEGGELFVNGTQAVSPVESYTLSFDYSPYKDSYYFVRSEPKCFYHKESDSKVVFSKVNANEETQKYSIVMHPFITLRIKDTEHHWIVDDLFDKGAIKKIEKNSESLEKYKKGSEELKKAEIDISKLKIGDTVAITVGKDYKLVCSNLDLSNPIPMEEGYKYTIKFPENNEKSYQIEISTRNSEAEGKFEPPFISNGTFSLSYENGGDIKQGVELPAEGQRVELKIIGNDGFYVSGNDTENGIFKKTMSFSDYQRDIDKIISNHPIKKFISIKLPEKDAHGSCTYEIDGKTIKDVADGLRDNQKLKMTYTLNDDDRDLYEIERTNVWDGFWAWATGSSEVTVEIPINEDLNGMELVISDYIKLKEKD